MKDSEKKKTKLIKHLRRNGNISHACKHADISVRNYYYWLDDAEFKNEVREAKIEYLRHSG